jgi:signal transduction histidine kinase
MVLNKFVTMLNFFDTVPVPTIVVNKENNIVFINKIGLQFLKLTKQDFFLRPLKFLFPEMEINKLKTKENFTSFYNNSNGVNQPLLIQFDTHTIENIEYKLFYILEIKNNEIDLNTIHGSFIKEKENEIELENKFLKIKNKELEEFNYLLSHDLQEPLMSIISYSKLLEDEYQDILDDEGKMFVKFINKSAVRMRNLISGLMQYASINKIEDLVETNFQIVLEEVQEDLANKINKYNAIINFEKLPTLYCYPTYIRLLFQNLISNAIKFSKQGVYPKIEITYSERENDWLFKVKDNGIGIDSKNSEQIFMIFKKLHTETIFKGHGIGLAHCKKIIEFHNGEIWVESILGEGSTFNFSISKII